MRDNISFDAHAIESKLSVLESEFHQGANIADIIEAFTDFIDNVLVGLWQRHGTLLADACLIAIGGYGRRELFPHSDIDILILVEDFNNPTLLQTITLFLATLWNLKRNIGHSVRTTEDCHHLATTDVASYTALLEARLICGNAKLYEQFRSQMFDQRVWSDTEFFLAKRAEEMERHEKYSNTAYHLEPDIKNYPGNLRDIHTLCWLAKHCLKTRDLQALVERGFLFQTEYHALLKAQHFLWKIRFVLHRITDRHEDRLLFDYQVKLAKAFGYKDESVNLAVEQFMKKYFRAVRTIVALHELILLLFEEMVFAEKYAAKLEPFHEHYLIKHDSLDIIDEATLLKHPEIMIEIFYILIEYPELKGLTANALRLLHKHRHMIDTTFRDNKLHQKLFLAIFKSQKNIAPALKSMNRYNILGQYIHDFDLIVGQMQYDLFHVYTVDQHTLFLIERLYQFTLPELENELPIAHQLINAMSNREIVYLAALFHDIGKGRSGNHSMIGAKIAEDFATLHGFDHEKTALLIWLVKNHLLMSSTAQRKDINDPKVIAQFAKSVKNNVYLQHLYVLTIADIYATNPKLWNSWKHALLKQLYEAAAAFLEEKRLTFTTNELIKAKQDAAKLLLPNHYDEKLVREHWANCGEDYFIRENEATIAWHTEAILDADDITQPLILIRTLSHRGATEIFIHTPDKDNLFATSTAVLDRFHLNIVEAKIITSKDGYSLDTYMVLDESDKPIFDDRRLTKIKSMLQQYHQADAKLPPYSRRRVSTQLQHFRHQTVVRFKTDKENQRTELTVQTADRPGLLARIGRAFVDCGIHLHNAKINTLGDKIEDTFVITGKDLCPLNQGSQLRLRKQLLYHISKIY